VHGAGRAAGRVVADFAAEGVGQQLVAVADAEHRRIQLGGVADPFGGALAPVFLVGHHGRRTGDEDRPVAARAGRALAFIDGHDFDFGMAQAGGATYLVGVTTIVGLEGGIGIAGLDDQDWGRHKNVVGIQGKTWHRKHSLWKYTLRCLRIRLEAATTSTAAVYSETAQDACG
jgi:hypothetical protein